MPSDIQKTCWVLALISSLQMDLVTKFQAANAWRHVNIRSLEIGRQYPIVFAERVTTRFGSTVLVVIQDSPASTVRLFRPRRYATIVSSEDIAQINTQGVNLHLVFKGTCVTTNSYILAIEQ
jgi:hypothetical protein